MNIFLWKFTAAYKLNKLSKVKQSELDYRERHSNSSKVKVKCLMFAAVFQRQISIKLMPQIKMIDITGEEVNDKHQWQMSYHFLTRTIAFEVLL